VDAVPGILASVEEFLERLAACRQTHLMYQPAQLIPVRLALQTVYTSEGGAAGPGHLIYISGPI